ncbi:hypothetical protein B0T14DRAFT_524149 [Immersiella caudata]|uniref:Uncharacterized protein n=1 Tax=Immersiella caudata TaxID=314043 RepID=A0AA39WKC7_9PEZI|nr:hypothetical protein B0T14DRAFT_524149 [Immersiella caudata]
MKVLPVNIPKVAPTQENIKRAAELREMHEGKQLKGRVNTDHREPQCPKDPPGLVSGTKPGYELDQGNFCEDLNEWWGISPFDFDGACAIQSLCFDQCSGWSFDGCVAAFSAAMYLSCLNEFDSWWDALEAAACAIQATVFVGFAATSTGERLYNKANEAMCRCFCSNPPDTCVFLDDNGEFSDKFYCANIKGNDGDNCGNCGRLCGANSACHSGVCGCPKDQCGDLCLDFRNNPNHCGKCNNPCDPKYCIAGECYAPKPGECAPDQAVTNGNFATFSPTWKNWTLAPYPGTTMGAGMNMEPIATNYKYDPAKDPVMAIGFKANNIPAAGYHLLLSQKEVKMCEGFNYEMTFALGFANQLNGEGVVSNADCKVRWLTGPPSAHNTDDGYKSSLSYSIGSSNPTFKTFGPWTLNVKKGDKGVTSSHGNLYIELSAVISCYQPPGGYGLFILTDVQMNPIGKVSKRMETLGNETFGFPLIDSREIAPVDMESLLQPYHPEFVELGLSKTGTKKR